MALSKNDIDLIERHFEGALNDEDENLIIEKAKLSASFREEFELQKTMVAAIRQEDRRVLKEELKKEVKKINLSSFNVQTIKWSYALAATVSLLVIATYLVLPSNSSLFETYFTPFPESPITRSGSIATDNYTLAMQHYSIEEYQKALDNFLSVKDVGLRDEVALYIGNCYLELNESEKAISHLLLAMNSASDQIQLQGQWYIALAYLNSGEKLKAKEQLNTIISSGNSYSDSAASLLRKLYWSFY